MNDSQLIMKLAKQNNGVITTAMVVAMGCSRGSLKYLADKGMLEKSSRGVYTLPEVWDDEFVNLQGRYNAVYFRLELLCFYGIFRIEHQIDII